MKMLKITKFLACLVAFVTIFLAIFKSSGDGRQSAKDTGRKLHVNKLRFNKRKVREDCKGEITVEIRSEEKIPSFAFKRNITLIHTNFTQEIAIKEEDTANAKLRTYQEDCVQSLCFHLQIEQSSYYEDLFEDETYSVFYNGFMVESGRLGSTDAVMTDAIGSACVRTAQPSDLPSRIPSFAPTNSPSDNPTTLVKFIGQCTTERKCGLCEGDCDSSDSCKDGFKCVRKDSEAVVECKGAETVPDASRICVPEGFFQPSTNPPTRAPAPLIRYVHECTPTNKCGECESDCDSSDSCEEDLVCVQRDSFENVVGCRGNGGSFDYKGADVCAKPLIREARECSSVNKCGLCEGRCTTDTGCEGNLICHKRDRFEVIDKCVGEGLENDVYGMNVCARRIKGAKSGKSYASSSSMSSPESKSEDDYSSPFNVDHQPIDNSTEWSFPETDTSGLRRFPRTNYLNENRRLPSDFRVHFPLETSNSAEEWFSEEIYFDENCQFLLNDYQHEQKELIDILCIARNTSIKSLITNVSLYEPEEISLHLPETITGADLIDANGDNETDLILTFLHRGGFSIYLRDGQNFSIPIHYNSQKAPISFTICDINGDEDVDVIFLEHKSASIFAFLNQGSDGFTEETIVYNSTEVFEFDDVMGGYLNNDKFCDLVLVSEKIEVKNTVLINRFDSSRWAFEEHYLPQQTQNNARKRVYLGDIDGDNHLDIIITSYGDQNQILFNNGTGYFNQTVNLPGGSALTKTIALGDVSGNGLLDIVVANDDTGDSIILNKGQREFEAEQNLFPNFRADTVLAVDVTGDGTADLLEANETILIFRKNSVESDRYDYFKDLSGSEDSKSVSLSAGYINNDTSLDVVIGNWDEINLILINDGSGNFIKTSFGEPTDETFQVGLTDLDNDGDLDILCLNKGTKSETFMNDGQGNFELNSTLPVSFDGERSERDSFASGHLNNDAFADILIVGGNCSGCIFINDGSGSFHSSLSFNFDDQSIVAAAIYGFQNQTEDSNLDVILAYDDFTWEIFFNNGGLNFTRNGKFGLIGNSSLHTITSISIGDIDNDERVDILFSTRLRNKGSIEAEPYDQIIFNALKVENQKGETKDPSTTSRTLSMFEPQILQPKLLRRGNTEVVSLFDVDNDGWLDAVIGTPLGETNYFLNNVSLGVIEKSQLTIFQSVDEMKNLFAISDTTWKCEDIAIGDFLGTGRNDIIFAHSENTNQMYSHISCPNGGAQLHRSSWCFRCPHFMGLSSPRSGICVECIPDHVQDVLSEFCSAKKCPLAHRELREDKCEVCPHGKYYDQRLQRLPYNISTWRENRCKECKIGTYANGETKTEIDECTICPRPLTTTKVGSKGCDACKAGYFLTDITVNATELNFNPTSYCQKCPDNVKCEAKTDISNMELETGFWRESNTSKVIYECLSRNACTHTDAAMASQYCKEGHTGPLCQLCINSTQYFNGRTGECKDCPTITDLIILPLFATAIVLGLMALLLRYIKTHRLTILLQVIISLNFQTKMKILVGFFQVIASLPVVYGVALDTKFRAWFHMCKYLSLDAFSVIVFARSCYGSRNMIYIFGAIWPFILLFKIGIILLFVKLALHFKGKCINTQHNHGNDVSASTRRMPYKRFDSILEPPTFQSKRMKRLYAGCIVVVLFYSLPTVSTSIFDAKKCVSYLDQITSIDTESDITSYLRADLNMTCNEDTYSSEQYQYFETLFWTFFSIWLGLIPLLFFLLICKMQKSIALNKPSELAMTCRFLWQDYNEESLIAIHWDFIETIKKIVLTGFINLIDIRDGSDKLLRSIVANVLLIVFLVLLVFVKPYKRSDDLKLAVVSNTILLLCFLMSIILHHCEIGSQNNWYLKSLERYSEGGACELFISSKLTSEYASTVVAISVIVMLILTIALIFFLSNRSPILRLKKTGYPPDMQMVRECSHHLFMSHRWDTGQDATHAIARKLKLYLSAMRIWLDVDDLSSTGDLESWVQKSSAVLIVYTKGYFESWNCRREFFNALQFKKPIILVYNGDNTNVSKIVQDCADNCNYEGIKEVISNLNSMSSQKSREDDNGQDSLFASNRSSIQINDSYLINEIHNEVQGFMNKCSNESDYFPIEWLKVGKFSLESLKLIYHRVLQELPFYKEHRYLLEDGLRLPEEANPKSLHALVKSSPSICLAFPGLSKNNKMAEDLETLCRFEFEESLSFIWDDAGQNDGDKGLSQTISAQIISKQRKKKIEVAILYLNDLTFSSHSSYSSNIREEIEDYMERNTPIILVHEKDPEEGGCEFVFKEQLQNLGLTSTKAQILFQDIAIPLYKRPEYRKVSIQLLLEKVLLSAKQQTTKTMPLKKCLKGVNLSCDRFD